MVGKIFLPELKHISIKNYSLYNQDIEYDFIDGINLIIGGNGVGKTTFINIIKYALIGLYKKDLTVRNYQGEKRLSRSTYNNCNTYFRDRTQNTLQDQNAIVTLTFRLNNCDFEVTRGLYDTILLNANYKTNNRTIQIEGNRIRQDFLSKYENDETSEKNDCLQYNYERIVAEKANMTDFNDFIFFVNQILLFGEDRLNVLWDVDTQSRLLSNYLNDKRLEKERKECKLDEKYQDSIARHKQEEIKAIRKVLDQVSNKQKTKNRDTTISELILEIEKKENYLTNVNNKCNKIQNELQLLHKKIADISILINDLEKEKNKTESTLMSQYWPGINSKYLIFKQQIERNHICPMCNSNLGDNVDIQDDECFFCHSKIENFNNNQIDILDKKLALLLSERQNYEIQLINYENDLDELDKDARTYRVEVFTLKNQLREMENMSKGGMETEAAYVAMINRINELTIEKEKAQKKCEQLRNQGQVIMQKIEKNLVDSTQSISKIFKEFSEAFLHLPCYLALAENPDKKIKIFVPVIDGKERMDSEELSESQRFFIDYSFRMSILAYFYNAASFYICETPDSSLDISYEENAANTLIKYTERPNSLIITSNLNNSVFIKHLLSKSNKVSILNLLKYGKISQVQINHQELQKLSNEIEVLASEKI